MPLLTLNHFRVPEERVVAISALSFVVVLPNPLKKAHVVCLPKRVCPKQTDLTADEFCDLYDLATRVAKALSERESSTGVTYIVNDVFDAGRAVGHVHLHVIPRNEGDFKGDSLSDDLEFKSGFPEGLTDAKALSVMSGEEAEESADLRRILGLCAC